VLHRVLRDDGFHCVVIAPSLIPKTPGDRRKTDRIDAVNLAYLYRGGHLTPVHVPSSEQVELRQLLRLRGRYQQQAKSTKLRVTSILRTHGIRFTDGASLWTKKHRAWLEQMRTTLTGPLGVPWPGAERAFLGRGSASRPDRQSRQLTRTPATR
jgi:transposase